METFHGARGLVLLPRLKDERVGLATVWDVGEGSITLWRSVFERRAPGSLERIEELIGQRLGQGKVVPNITSHLLEALTGAYREAVGRSTRAEEG